MNVLLLTLTITAGVALVYLPHVQNPYPLLGDEYVHLSFAQQFLADGTLFQNPYLAPKVFHLNFESGFHVFLSGIVFLLGEHTMLLYQYFPAFFFILNALLLYYLMRLWTGDHWAALLAVFFFGTIGSSGPILAHHYFLPLTLGTTLLLLLCISFQRWTTEHGHRQLLYLILLLFAAILAYPPTVFFFLGVILVYVLAMDHRLHERFALRKSSFFLTALGGALLAGAAGYALLRSLGLFDEVLFYTAWAMQQNRISLVLYFGIIPSAFAALGIYLLLRGDRSYHSLPLYWFCYAAAAIYIYYLFGASLFVPFPRLYYFYLIGVCALAGIGAVWLLHLAQQRFHTTLKRSMVFAACALLLCMHYIGAAAADLRHADILNDEKYAALSLLREQFPGAGVVITDAVTSFAVTPVTGKHVVGLLDANVGGGDPAVARRFLSGACPEKARALEQLKEYFTEEGRTLPLFMLSSSLEDCAFVTLLSGEGPYLYTITPGKATTMDIMSLTRRERDDLLKPPEQYATPLRPTLDEAALRELLPGNTVEGNGWSEYFAPDGTIRGRMQAGEYPGVWKITGSVYCYYYPKEDAKDCRTVTYTDGIARFYNMHGAMSVEARIVEGNPHGL